MNLPLLDYLCYEFAAEAGCLEGWGCIYVQHILGSNVACAHFLNRMGLDKHKLRIVGKAYSTSAAALADYEAAGFQACSIGQGYDFCRAFDDAIVEKVTDEITGLHRDGVRNLLLIDEGGIAMQAIAPRTAEFNRLAVVELTARGAHKYGLIAQSSPIVDVARSVTKKTLEPPLIARSMVEHLGSKVLEVTSRELSGLRIGIVGMGAIGTAVANELSKSQCVMKMYDEEPTRCSVLSLRELVSYSDLVLSSTGVGCDWGEVFAETKASLLFANCGSSDVEFRLWQIRNRQLSLPNLRFSIENELAPWTGLVTVSHNAGLFRFLNGSFPINFDGSSDPIPPLDIQISRAILMAGAIQSVLSNRVGVQGLDETLQRRLALKYAN